MKYGSNLLLNYTHSPPRSERTALNYTESFPKLTPTPTFESSLPCPFCTAANEPQQPIRPYTHITCRRGVSAPIFLVVSTSHRDRPHRWSIHARPWMGQVLTSGLTSGSQHAVRWCHLSNSNNGERACLRCMHVRSSVLLAQSHQPDLAHSPIHGRHRSSHWFWRHALQVVATSLHEPWQEHARTHGGQLANGLGWNQFQQFGFHLVCY